VSHRTHHGRLGAQHTESEFARPRPRGRSSPSACPLHRHRPPRRLRVDLRPPAPTSSTGACTVTSSRLLTDSGVNLTTPDGLALELLEQAQRGRVSAAFTQLGAVIGLLGKLVAAQAQPTPVPPHPASPPMLEAPDQ
jgi:hypothetical protein